MDQSIFFSRTRLLDRRFVTSFFRSDVPRKNAVQNHNRCVGYAKKRIFLFQSPENISTKESKASSNLARERGLHAKRQGERVSTQPYRSLRMISSHTLLTAQRASLICRRTGSLVLPKLLGSDAWRHFKKQYGETPSAHAEQVPKFI
jgi:hypothetical protein